MIQTDFGNENLHWCVISGDETFSSHLFIFQCMLRNYCLFLMYTMCQTETHYIDPNRILPVNALLYTNVHFIAINHSKQTNKVQWKGCTVPPKCFLRVLIADVQAAIRFIKDVQHSGGILQPRAKKNKKKTASCFGVRL